ncbi:hypothetical protein Syun_001360 [Stephania yunnanensis]|uniref:Uncharacterized protein n=1 Tax=Stephania yunnanensis TaxID=152371 RepID=A0AAP0LEK5_9MAGN
MQHRLGDNRRSSLCPKHASRRLCTHRHKKDGEFKNKTVIPDDKFNLHFQIFKWYLKSYKLEN